MYRFLVTIIISSLCISSAWASETIQVSTAAGLQREAREAIKSITSSTGKSWATARVGLYANTMRYASKLNNTDAQEYKKEVSENAAQYLNDILNGTYVFDISATDRARVEDVVLSYQKDMTQVVRTYIEQYKNSDKKETGDIHFTLQSSDANITVDVDRYRVVQSQDLKNMEVDLRISVRITGKDGTLSTTLDANVMIVDSSLYFTLKDYSFSTTLEEVEIGQVEKVLRTIKSKTYHQRLNKEFSDALKDSKKSIEMTEKLLSILETESLLTPVASQGSEYVLMFRKGAVQKIISLSRTPMVVDISPKNLLIPIDIRTNGTDIDMSGYADSTSLKAHISRESDGTPIMILEGSERGGYNMWNWKISKTPSFWAFAGASEEYTIDAQANKNGATATIKKGTKTVATARISSTGIRAWAYDMTAIWEDISYDWETEESTSEDIRVRLWGALRQEFGNFVLTPPNIYEEMERLQQQLEDL